MFFSFKYSKSIPSSPTPNFETTFKSGVPSITRLVILSSDMIAASDPLRKVISDSSSKCNNSSLYLTELKFCSSLCLNSLDLVKVLEATAIGELLFITRLYL